eukprot:scaffold236956_cov19-Tisochrysis_lutea.AAC.1
MTGDESNATSQQNGELAAMCMHAPHWWHQVSTKFPVLPVAHGAQGYRVPPPERDILDEGSVSLPPHFSFPFELEA